MSKVDLIPMRYRIRLQKYGLIKYVLVAAAICLLINFGMYICLIKLNASVAIEVATIQNILNLKTKLRDDLIVLADQKLELEEKWKLLSQLNTGIPAESIFKLIDKTVPSENVWFTNLEFTRSKLVVDDVIGEDADEYLVVSSGRVEIDDGKRLGSLPTILKIRGQAKDYVALAKFVENMLDFSLVYGAKVDQTSLTKVNQVDVVDFSMSVVIKGS